MKTKSKNIYGRLLSNESIIAKAVLKNGNFNKRHIETENAMKVSLMFSLLTD